MKIHSFIKQPSEFEIFAIDMSLALATGESLVLSNLYGTLGLVVTDEDDVDVTTDILEGDVYFSGSEVRFMFKGGTDGETYNLKFLITSDFDRVIEEDGILVVTEFLQ